MQWREKAPAARARPGKGPLALRVGLSDRCRLRRDRAGDREAPGPVGGRPPPTRSTAWPGSAPTPSTPRFDVDALRRCWPDGRGNLKTRPGRPVGPRRGGQRLLRRGAAPGQAVAVQAGRASSTDDEVGASTPPCRDLLTDAVERVRGAAGQGAQGGEAQWHGGARPDRASRARCAATRCGRCPSPPSRCSTARPARPAASRSPTAACPGCFVDGQAVALRRLPGKAQPPPVPHGRHRGGRRPPRPRPPANRSATRGSAGIGPPPGVVRWWNDDLNQWVRWRPGADAPPRPPGWEPGGAGGTGHQQGGPGRVAQPVPVGAARPHRLVVVIGLIQAPAGRGGQDGGRGQGAAKLAGPVPAPERLAGGHPRYSATAVSCGCPQASVKVVRVLPGHPGRPRLPGRGDRRVPAVRRRPLPPRGVRGPGGAADCPRRPAKVWPTCGRGSAGRASPCQGEGRGFESRRPLQESRRSGAIFRVALQSQRRPPHARWANRTGLMVRPLTERRAAGGTRCRATIPRTGRAPSPGRIPKRRSTPHCWSARSRRPPRRG